MAQRNLGNSTCHVGDAGDAADFHSHVICCNGFARSAHAHSISTDETAHLHLGRRLVVGARQLDMPANWMYKRGDVYMMDLNPYSGSEQGGIRPAIVVQNDDGNFYSNVLLVVPLTTQIKKRNMPTHFILHNRFLSAPSMAICESPRPADKSRVLSYLGHLSKYEMRQVSVCLQYSFGFIGYKSFRKYLTAPPQEDVLAAAKELLSQQFQNLRVLNSQPPALAKHTKGDLHSIEQISEKMLSTPTESSVEFMVAELDDALQSLMFRWNICYERYSSFRLSDNEKKKIGLIIQSGIDFLQKKKEVPL